MDAGDDSSHEETQQFLQSLIDESNEISKQRSPSSTLKMKKSDYKRLMYQLLRDLTEEESKRLFQLGGAFDPNNDDDLFQKIQLLMQIRKDKRGGAAPLSPSQSSNSSSSYMHTAHNQLNGQQQSTQGGQGQQKQTAHKPVAKAHTGRPNPRKRR